MKRILLLGFIIILISLTVYFFLNKRDLSKEASAYGVTVVPYNYKLFLPSEDVTGNYSLYQANAIKIDHDDNVFILDAGNNRIMKYDKKGKFLQQIGRVGQGPGELLDPINFDIDDEGTIYVWNYGNSRIEIFDGNGNYIHSFKILFPTARWAGMAVGPAGSIYLNLPSSGSLIVVFTKTGEKIKQFGKIKEFKNPLKTMIFNQGSMHFDKKGDLNFLFVTKPLFRRYSQDGHLLLEKVIKGPEIDLAFKTWEKQKKKYAGSPGVRSVVFFYDFALTDNGDFFASLWAKKAIYHFSKSVNIIRKFVPEVDDEDLLTGRIAISSDGRLFVLNPYSSNIQIFRKEGEFR